MANPNLKNFYLPVTRVHCTEGYRWAQSAATDYWLNMNSGFDIFAAASTAVSEQLTENGWVATSIVNTAATGGDAGGGLFTRGTSTGPKSGRFAGTFGDLGTPNHALLTDSGDILNTPSMFGSGVAREQAAVLAGMSSLPGYLIADFWASFTVVSADEATTAVGFYEDNATISSEADQYAVIRASGTGAVMLLQGNSATMQSGPVGAAGWSKWRIVIQFNGASAPSCTAYKDGAPFSATTVGTGAQDEFPLKFGMHSLTTNRIGLGALHIFYDW